MRSCVRSRVDAGVITTRPSGPAFVLKNEFKKWASRPGPTVPPRFTIPRVTVQHQATSSRSANRYTGLYRDCCELSTSRYVSSSNEYLTTASHSFAQAGPCYVTRSRGQGSLNFGSTIRIITVLL